MKKYEKFDSKEKLDSLNKVWATTYLFISNGHLLFECLRREILGILRNNELDEALGNELINIFSHKHKVSHFEGFCIFDSEYIRNLLEKYRSFV